MSTPLPPLPPSLAGYRNVAETLLASATEQPDRFAVVCAQDELTYAELNRRVNRICALLLAHGVRAGDRVAYLLPNSAVLIEVYYAIQKIGAIAVPINFRSVPAELEYFLGCSGASVLIFAHPYADTVAAVQGAVPGVRLRWCVGGATGWAPDLQQAAAGLDDAEPPILADGEAISRIQFTGGSTGAPKAAERSHRADLTELEGIYTSNWLYADPAKVVLIQCPLEHHGGHSWFASAIALGATLVLCCNFDAEAILDRIQRYRVSYMILLPPSTYLRLLAFPRIGEYDLSSVRLVQSSAGATSAEIVAETYRRFPNAVVNYGWGQTETGLGTSLALTPEMALGQDPRIRSIGRPMPGIELKVVDEQGCEVPRGTVGEGAARSAALMTGYHGQPELTAAGFTADGWWRTGDLMIQDADGYFYLKGRKRELIKTGGENVFVGEVESLLRDHPAVLDAMVYGEEDAVLGETVAAVVELRQGAGVTLGELQAFCRERLASYKKPRSLSILDTLDRDFSGKLRRDEVIGRAREEFARQASLEWQPDLDQLMERICSDPMVHRITVPTLPWHPESTNTYLVVGEQGCLLVDPGAYTPAGQGTLLRALEAVGAEAVDVLITHEHPDHSGIVARWLPRGSRLFRGAQGFGLAASAAQRYAAAGFSPRLAASFAAMALRSAPPAVAAVPAERLSGGEPLTLAGLRAEVIPTPGHTDGHLCLFLPDSGILFAGDHVLWRLAPALFSEAADPIGAYVDGLDAIDRLPVTQVLPGHGRPRSAAELHDRVRYLKEHHESRITGLRRAVAEQPGVTAAELLAVESPGRDWNDLDEGQQWCIASTTLARLAHLKTRGGLTTVDGPDGLTHYHAIAN